MTGYAAKSVTLSKYSTNKIKLQDVFINNALGIISFTGPGSLVECLLRGTGGHEFSPGPRHIKFVKNSTSCASPGTQTYGVELILVDPVLITLLPSLIARRWVGRQTMMAPT